MITVTMRRRRDAAGRSQGGIFLLAPDASSTCEDKYLRRSHRRDRNSWVFRALVALALFKAFEGRARNAGGIMGGGGSMAGLGFWGGSGRGLRRAAPNDARPTIPRRLVFTYKYDLLSPTAADPPFDGTDPLTANVNRTIHQYTDYWKQVDKNKRARSSPTSNPAPAEKTSVHFLSDSDCLRAVSDAAPRLVPHFARETAGRARADLCRAAELYLRGGYYFDADLRVVHPVDFDGLYLPPEVPDPIWHLKAIRRKRDIVPREDDIVTFATVYDRRGVNFQAFVAALPGHPVLRRALDLMVAYYEGTLDEVLPEDAVHAIDADVPLFPSKVPATEMGVGPFALAAAYRTTSDGEWERFAKEAIAARGYVHGHEGEPRGVPARTRYSRHLYEVSLEDEDVVKMGLFADYPLQDATFERKVGSCNRVVFHGHLIYFYSNAPGSSGCPMEKKAH